MQIRRPLCLLAVFFTILLFFIGKLPTQEDPPPVKEREKILVTGCVSRREQKNESFTYDLKQVTVYHNTAASADLSKLETIIKKKGSLKILVDIQGDEVLCIKERVVLSGAATLFEPAENEGQFDAALYYGKKGYAFRIFQGKVLLRDRRYNRIKEGLQRWKEETSAFFVSVLGSSQGSVLTAMVLGEKKGMDAEIKDLYRQNGISHILAISGLHISLLGLFLYRGLRKVGIPLIPSGILGMGLIFFYGFLVGGTSSVVRASVMLSMQIFGDLVNRSYDMLTAMAVSGLLLLTVFPEYLTDAGFLLSFLAVFGIALVAPALLEGKGILLNTLTKAQPGEREVRRKKEKESVAESIGKKMGEALCISLAVSLTTLPVILWYYYEFPLYAILLNLLLVPLMGIVLVSGISAALFRISFLLMPSWAILSLYEAVCRAFLKLPWHMIRTGRPQVWKMLLYYIALILFIRRWGTIKEGKVGDEAKKEKERKLVCIINLSILLVALLLLLSGSGKENRVDMLSVGQGDCIVLLDDKGHVVICDGGSSTVSSAGTYRLIPFLKYHGIKKIDAVYLSHPHEDHYSALAELFEQSREEGFRIGGLYVSGYARSDPEYALILESAKTAGVRTAVVSPGQRQSFGEIDLLVCYPDQHPVSDDANDQSMVLLGNLGGFSILLTGDATSLTDPALFSYLEAAGVDKVNCLKAEHHGSREANSKQLLTFLKPDIAIISCGKNNRYGHPHPETLQRLAKYGIRTYVTSGSGQIMIRCKDSGFSVQGFSD